MSNAEQHDINTASASTPEFHNRCNKRNNSKTRKTSANTASLTIAIALETSITGSG